ncbi:MAG: hypothetical protein ABI339_06060 [Solirubrobacteraceae bacterium]
MSFMGPNPAPPRQLGESNAAERQHELSDAAAREAARQPEMEPGSSRPSRALARRRSLLHH